MDVAALQAYCLSKPGAWTDFPWDHDFPVVKVGEGERGKIFAFLGSDSVGVKGGPTREVADEWLDRYPDAATVMRYRKETGRATDCNAPGGGCGRRGENGCNAN